MPAQSPSDPHPQPAEAIHADPTASRPEIRVTTPAELLSMVPYLLGFHPDDSVVVIGMGPAGNGAQVALRYPLPSPDALQRTTATADHATRILAVQEYTAAAVAGYGPDDRVTPFISCFRNLADAQGIEIQEALRAGDGRYWSYRCADPDCCPPEGTPYELTDDPELHRLLPEGSSGLLQRREDLAAVVAPVAGEAADAMRQATRRAEARVTKLLDREPQPGQPSGKARVIAAGIDAVQVALARYQQDKGITYDVAAQITVALHELQVRDDCWARLTPENRKASLRLLLELTRLARAPYVAPVATLLAFVAWQCGNGALANLALDRALADRPNYTVAKLLREALNAGAPPRLARMPYTPEEIAARYAEQDSRKGRRLT